MMNRIPGGGGGAPYQGSLDHYAREAGQDLGETLQQNKRDSAAPRDEKKLHPKR